MKTLVILSGGQDSTSCLFMEKAAGKELHAISFDYGQRHSIELEAAKKVAELAGCVSHEIVDIKGIMHSTSPLLSDRPLEQFSDHKEMLEKTGTKVEDTFVPMRNTLFLAIAFNRAVEIGAREVVTGICESDTANYPDCTSFFRSATEFAFNIGLGIKPLDERISISAPLVQKEKWQSIIDMTKIEGAWKALAYTHTSYDGKYPPTDNNHANVLRAASFEKAGLPDPLVVRAFYEGIMILPATPNYAQKKVVDTWRIIKGEKRQKEVFYRYNFGEQK